MADAISVSGADQRHRQDPHVRDRQAGPAVQGAVVATIGDTIVLATANAAKGVREGIDFFPLTVDVEERAYAAGKIPGSFFRREGRPTDHAILTCRLIDRPLRPSFPDGYRNETQVVVTVIGADQENPHDVLAINAASAALMLSGIPFDGPIGAVRLAYSHGRRVDPAPHLRGGRRAHLRARRRRPRARRRRRRHHDGRGRRHREGVGVLRGRRPEGHRRGHRRRASRPAKVVDQGVDRRCSASWSTKAGAREPLEYTPVLDYGDDVFDAGRRGRPTIARARALASPTRPSATRPPTTPTPRSSAELIAGEFDGREKEIKEAVRSLTKKLVRKRIVEEGSASTAVVRRDLRPLSAEVGIAAHGARLGPVPAGRDPGAQRLHPRHAADGPAARHARRPRTNKRYMHHYNMPPHANGETGRVGQPKRREIGHGLLAERALLPVVPSKEEFPYTLRLVSEVLSSNGSTSMASVCWLVAVAHGRRRADQGAGRRHRHGPRVRRRQVHDPHRHPRRRGRLRRHGLQGRRHRRLRHRPAARHQDRRPPRRRAGRRAAAGPRGPPADPRGHDTRPSPSPVPRSARPRRRSSASRSRSTRSARSSGPRARSSTPSSRRPAPTSPSTTTAWSAPSPSARPTVARSPRPGARSSSSSTRRRAEVGEIYPGRVVNITKFGAFVNILPGRDGLRAHLQAGRRQAHRPGRGRARPRRRDRGAGRRHRPERQGLAQPRSSRAMRATGPPRAAATVEPAGHPGSPAEARRRARPAALPSRSRTPSTPRLVSSSATSAPLRRPRLGWRLTQQRQWRPRPRAASQRRQRGRPPSLRARASSARSWLRVSVSSLSECPRPARRRRGSGSASAHVTSPTR